MTVFVVQEASPQHDLAAAAQFGEFRHINRYYIHGDELKADVGNGDWIIPDGYRLNMERALADFKPETDYLLIYGDHLQLVAFTAMLAGYFEWFRVLRWDRQISGYIPVLLRSSIAPRDKAVLSSTHIGDTTDAEVSREVDQIHRNSETLLRLAQQQRAASARVHRKDGSIDVQRFGQGSKPPSDVS